jgi:outer membrane murein-binding lipoprotein Lpp
MKAKGIVAIFLLTLPCVLLSGCLSFQFGGKTHNCTGAKDTAEANARIAQLENRINTLEHYASIPPSERTGSQVSTTSYQSDYGGVRVRVSEK